MAQTRSKDKVANANGKPAESKAEDDSKPAKAVPAKRKAPKAEPSQDAKKPKASGDAPASQPTSDSELKDKITHLLDTLGDEAEPLNGLVDYTWPKSKQVMAHIFHALLSSKPISHSIATRTLKAVVDAGYADLETLKNSTWEQRTKVLTEGGYTHYRETGATYFGDLASLMNEKYEGDAAKILPDDTKHDAAQKELGKRVGEVKGLGPMGTQIFLGTIQGICPAIAPFLDDRSRKTTAEIGIEADEQAIFAAVGNDAAKMARVETALTKIRLEKREKEFAT